jgi:histidinol-phosphatase
MAGWAGYPSPVPAQPAERRTHRDLCQFALELLDETDALVLRHLAGGLTVKAKTDTTLVTQADTEVETLTRERIADAYPDHGVLGEEFGSEAGASGMRWIVDPIDGTHNLVRGIPVFGTLLAVEDEGELVVAAISAPAMARRWWAVRGEGAVARDHLGERQLRVSSVDRLEESQLLTSGIGPLVQAGFGPAVSRLSTRVWRDRGIGDFWGYMLVAEGAAEAMLEIGPTLWDLAAPSLIVEEAGGRMTDFAGTRSHTGPQALASNGLLHDAVVAALAGE